jgi:hypothetical protein
MSKLCLDHFIYYICMILCTADNGFFFVTGYMPGLVGIVTLDYQAQE